MTTARLAPRAGRADIRQRGGVALAMALVLGLLALLTVGFAHRSLIFEQRTAANQLRAARAFEAAEAGLDWAVAMLNGVRPIDAHCQPSATGEARSFAERLTQHAELEAACLIGEGEWSCHCPAAGPAHAPAASSAPPAPARAETRFRVRLQAGPAGSYLVQAEACLGPLAACGDEAARTQRPDAQARTQVAMARIPGIGLSPSAALTARGLIDLSAAMFSLTHVDADGPAVTAHAGGEIEPGPAILATTPGAPALASLRALDTRLAAMSPDGLFASVFRLDRAAWRDQPAVARVACEAPCDALLDHALAHGHRLIWLDGGLRLSGPALIGTPQAPVLLVVDGPVQIDGAALIHGVVYVLGREWSSAAGARVRGAVIVDGDFRPSGDADLAHDAGVIRHLHERTGTYARIPGSWRDD